ncbi:Uncharacterised protein [Klebsiella grimontii]|nr:Uncharacterised protein [Klebsiella grimontii]
MPWLRASASLPPVQTFWPLLATMVAVPVSWQLGSTPFAETSALLSSCSATYLSLLLACGSCRMLAICFKCPARRKNEAS